MPQGDFSFLTPQREKIDLFLEILKKWQRKINLVSSATLEDLWLRHVHDSAQLTQYLKHSDIILDVGSGGGFPGLILSIMGYDQVHLLEPVFKKIAFLQEVIRKLALPAHLYQCRLEDFSPAFEPTVLTSRAFASVSKIFELANHFSRPSLRYVLLKGASFQQEIETASLAWHFQLEISPSMTHPAGRILIFSNVSPKNA